jgi:hypothetical protein
LQPINPWVIQHQQRDLGLKNVADEPEHDCFSDGVIVKGRTLPID